MEEDYQRDEYGQENKKDSSDSYLISSNDEDSESNVDSSDGFSDTSSEGVSNSSSDTPITDSLREQPTIISEPERTEPISFSKSPELSEIDRELEELLKKQDSSVKVFGIGGGGGNTVSRMREIGIIGGQFITINTDAQDLLYSNADHKILIGKELTNGLGAGSNPKIGEEAAHESEQEIKKSLLGSDMVFITCG